MAVATALAGIAAGAAVVSTGFSISAASDSRKQGKRNAEQERLATEERVRRLGVERDAVLGAQIAGAASGGVDINSGSVRSLQAETVAEFDRQISFTRRAGAFAADSANIQGRNAAFQNLSNGLSSLASAARIIKDAGGFKAAFGLA